MSENIKILIIKLGALGDVLRTTPILRRLRVLFPEAEINWVTLKDAKSLLPKDSFINKIYTLEERKAVLRKSFNIAFNFDEFYEACALLENVKADKKKGYILKNGRYYPIDKDGEYAYRLTKDDELKFKKNKKNYQEVIFEMAGLGKFKKEDYVINYISKSKGHGIALNHYVGEKWPTKSWIYWDKLEKELKHIGYKISMQSWYPTIKEYIKWIDKHEMVITSDTLGLHIALALKKKVIAIFGATPPQEIEMYGRGIKLFSHLKCAPCMKAVCPDKTHKCMRTFKVADIVKAIKRIQK